MTEIDVTDAPLPDSYEVRIARRERRVRRSSVFAGSACLAFAAVVSTGLRGPHPRGQRRSRAGPQRGICPTQGQVSA